MNMRVMNFWLGARASGTLFTELVGPYYWFKTLGKNALPSKWIEWH